MIRPKGLGRGLDALLAGGSEQSSAESLQTIAIDRLQAGQVPAAHAHGRGVARRAGRIDPRAGHHAADPGAARSRAARFEIIAGERRWRAAQRAGLTEVPALVRAVPDQAALALALIENIQREDLNPLEEAQGLERLIDEFGLTHDAAAKAVGRSRSAVTNLLRLRELAKPVQEYMLGGQLDMGHARALLGLAGGRADRRGGARRGAGTVGARDRAPRPSPAAPGAQARPRAPRARADPDLARLQEELAEILGAPVAIEPKRAGSGRVVIDYASLEQLDGLLQRFRR